MHGTGARFTLLVISPFGLVSNYSEVNLPNDASKIVEGKVQRPTITLVYPKGPVS